MKQSDKPERFEKLVTDHRKILYKVCNVYCANPDDREDLAQEITVQLWRSFDTFDGRGRFSTWMYRIALNVAISHLRSESRRARHVTSGSEQLLETVDETSQQPEEVRLLYYVIGRLDPLNKALIILYLDGNSYLEISEVLGISESNVATKLSRLKQTMKRELTK